MWSSKFKTKEEIEIERQERKLEEISLAIKDHEREILSGAPGKDFKGVRALKNQLAKRLSEQGKVRRLIEKLKQIIDRAGVK